MDGPAGIAYTADRPLAPARGVAGGALRPSARKALEHHAVVWLSSIRPDGAPHLLPLWFHWDGASILVFSKPGAQKVRNLRVNPRVMVAVGEPGSSFDVELIEADAELLPAPTQDLLPDGFVRKYATHMARGGVTPSCSERSTRSRSGSAPRASSTGEVRDGRIARAVGGRSE